MWSYFFLFLVICEKITLEVGKGYSRFLAFSLRTQKLGQQNALTYDMGNRDFAIKRNKPVKVNISAVVDIFFVVSLFSFQNEWTLAVSV